VISGVKVYVFRCIDYVLSYIDVDSEYQVHSMVYVPCVGFVTNSLDNMMIHFVCCIKKNKK
jgi:hypothetical protein